MNLKPVLKFQKTNVPRSWPQLSYGSEKRVPAACEPEAHSWPTYYLRRDDAGRFTDPLGNPIAFQVRQPDAGIDFEGEQLEIVKRTLQSLTPKQVLIAKYWGTGPPTKQWTPIIDILIDTYGINAPRATRILGATQAAMVDAMAVCWYYKFKWNIARPNQFDQGLHTVLPMPRHPAYPAGHGVMAGCAEVVLSYFFAPEAARLKELAEECNVSRLYAGVHYPIDNEEGIRLGRQIGEIVVGELQRQSESSMNRIDYPITVGRAAKLPPPPYKQVISY